MLLTSLVLSKLSPSSLFLFRLNLSCLSLARLSWLVSSRISHFNSSRFDRLVLACLDSSLLYHQSICSIFLYRCYLVVPFLLSHCSLEYLVLPCLSLIFSFSSCLVAILSSCFFSNHISMIISVSQTNIQESL